MNIRNYGPIEFTSVEKVDQPEQYLDFVKHVLDGLGARWCFAFGTALGLYREKGFIPQDTDIDVMILVDDIDPKDISCQFLDLTLIRTVIHEGDYHQVAFQSDDGFIVDLCFFYQDGEEYVSFCEGGHWKDPIDVIGDFTEVDTQYGVYPLPERIEDYLVIRYGDDWMIPRYGDQACSLKEE